MLLQGRPVDLLAMTATPIPRTMSMMLYGDLAHSVLDEVPAGRMPVRTFCRTPAAREKIYAFAEEQINQGRQVYVICPLVEPGVPELDEDDGLVENCDTVPCAVPWSQELARRLPGIQVGLLHGSLPQVQKDAVMAAFADGRCQLLVATTVVEVGLDVRNATVMVIEGAERFGLAQLHQLRGRVGRGPHPSFCILVSSEPTDRLDFLCHNADGFAIAEEDLRRRGPGLLWGTRQSGVPDIDASVGVDVMEQAAAVAREMLAADPELQQPCHEGLRQSVEALRARAPQ